MNTYLKSVSVALTGGVLIVIVFSGFITAWRDVIAATLFAFVFTASGFLSNYSALRMKNTVFFTIVFAGMFIRTIVMVAAIILWINHGSSNKKEFLVFLVLWYALLLIPEVLSFNRTRVKERY